MLNDERMMKDDRRRGNRREEVADLFCRIAGGTDQQPPYVGCYRPNWSAFTLIELVLVMAMLSIVLAVAFPSLSNFFRTRRIDSEARRVLSLIRYGQNRAVSEGVPMVLWIDIKQGAYGLEAETGYLDSDNKAVEYDLDETLSFEVTRPSVVRSTATSNGNKSVAGNLPAIRFMPDGFISETSPYEIGIRQGKDEEIWVAQSANRMNYEIQTARH